MCPYHSWGPLQFTAAELRAELGNKIPGGLESLGPKLTHLWHRQRRTAEPAPNQRPAVKARSYEPS